MGFLALVAWKRGEVFLLMSTLLSVPAVFCRTPHSCLAGAGSDQPYIHSNLYLICCPDLVLLSHFSPRASFSFLFWAPGCFDASSVWLSLPSFSFVKSPRQAAYVTIIHQGQPHRNLEISRAALAHVPLERDSVSLGRRQACCRAAHVM